MAEATENVRIRPDTSKYVAGVSGSGKKTKRVNDEVGAGLDGCTLDEVKQIATAMGVEDVDKYDHLNVGQRRMNLGNRIRGAVQRADKAKAKAQADAEKEDATAKQKAEAGRMKTGAELLEAALKPIRKVVDKRIAEANAERAKKAAAKEAAAK